MANSDAFPAAGAAALCERFIEAVESYFLWDRMKTPPHQVGTLEGILIGDFGATAVDYEARRIRAAVWIRDNGPALAAALERHGFKSLPVLRIVGFIDDPDAVPSDFRRKWRKAKAGLQGAAIRLRNTKPPPAAKQEQGEGAGGSDAAAKQMAIEPAASQRAALANLGSAVRKAYLAFEYAQTLQGRQLEDKESYDLLRENGVEPDCGELGELTDYNLPAFDTFTRYLRTARQALGEQKYNRRAGRPTGSSIVKADELDGPP